MNKSVKPHNIWFFQIHLLFNKEAPGVLALLVDHGTMGISQFTDQFSKQPIPPHCRVPGLW